MPRAAQLQPSPDSSTNQMRQPVALTVRRRRVQAPAGLSRKLVAEYLLSTSCLIVVPQDYEPW